MTQLTQEQTKTLEKNLLVLKQEIESLVQIDESEAATVELDQSKVGRLSRMDALQRQAIAHVSQEHHLIQLQMINTALIAIKEGDYGYCEACGKAIPFERLSIKPESHCCVSCQEKLEA